MVDPNGRFTPRQLRSGRYDVLIERPDYESVRQWIVIDDADVAVDIALPDMAPASAAPEALAMLQEAIGWYSPQNGQMDYARARRLFEQAAETGHPLAVMWLARSYVAGRVGFVKDVERAQELARGVIEETQRLARDGDREASFLLGSAYGEGLAVTQDHEQAVSWYRKAAEQGNTVLPKSIWVVAYRARNRGVEQS